MPKPYPREFRDDVVAVGNAGYELTLTLPKSISLYALTGDSERRGEQVTIDRVLVRRTRKEVDAIPLTGLHLLDNNYWQQEPPKAGMTATVPLPRPLWLRLVALADRRLLEAPMPMPAGRLLFRRPVTSHVDTQGIGVLDNTNFRRDVWTPARKAAGLIGGHSLPALDPRRNVIKVKDLRAFAASVLLDSDSSLTEVRSCCNTPTSAPPNATTRA